MIRLVHETWVEGEPAPVLVRVFTGATEAIVRERFLRHELADLRQEADGRVAVFVDGWWRPGFVRWGFFSADEPIDWTPPAVSAPAPPARSSAGARAPFVPRVIPGGKAMTPAAAPTTATGGADPGAPDAPEPSGKLFCTLADARAGG